MNKQMTRRSFVHLAAMVGGTALLGSLAGCMKSGAPAPTATPQPAPTPEPLGRLIMKGPPSPPTILLAHLAGQEQLKAQVPEVTFSTYKSPDQVRAEIASGSLHVAAVPTYLAANLYRKGLPIQLLNVTVWGILHVMTADGGLKSWEDLRGTELAVPFKGDMPDLVFRYLATKNGLDPEKDLKIQYVSAPMEALQLLLAGKVKTAVLPEPAATAAQMQGKQKGMSIRPMLDLQQEWGKATGRAARIPQAGTLVLSSVVKEHPEVIAALQAGMKQAVEWTTQNPAEAAALGQQHLDGMKAPVIQQSLARTPLLFATAADARRELEFFFNRLMELSPEIVGGGLPDDGFYGR